MTIATPNVIGITIGRLFVKPAARFDSDVATSNVVAA